MKKTYTITASESDWMYNQPWYAESKKVQYRKRKNKSISVGTKVVVKVRLPEEE